MFKQKVKLIFQNKLHKKSVNICVMGIMKIHHLIYINLFYEQREYLKHNNCSTKIHKNVLLYIAENYIAEFFHYFSFRYEGWEVLYITRLTYEGKQG